MIKLKVKFKLLVKESNLTSLPLASVVGTDWLKPLHHCSILRSPELGAPPITSQPHSQPFRTAALAKLERDWHFPQNMPSSPCYVSKQNLRATSYACVYSPEYYSSHRTTDYNFTLACPNSPTNQPIWPLFQFYIGRSKWRQAHLAIPPRTGTASPRYEPRSPSSSRPSRRSGRASPTSRAS